MAKSRDGEGGYEKKGGKGVFYKGGKPQPSFRSDGKSNFRLKDKTKPAFRGKPKPEAREMVKPANGGVFIWGVHAARAAWMNPKRRITRAWLTESGQKLFEATQKEALEELLKRPDAKRVEREELDRMTPPSSVHQGIVIETTALPELNLHDVIDANPPPDLILMLDQVTDPHNVGAILRSAAAFGAGAIVMTERNAPTTTGVLAKSASGALEHTPMIHVVNLARALDDLREAGYWCVGLAEEGEKNIGDLDLSGRTVLVLGAEGDGLRHLTRQKCDELARLPTGGPIGSLNVSNAAAVALYEVRRQSKA
jgi:23S rRNA (guanosine2251-2'-O)-methyltransferase